MTPLPPYLDPVPYWDRARAAHAKNDSSFLMLRRESEDGQDGEPKAIRCRWKDIEYGIFSIPSINKCFFIQCLRTQPILFANESQDHQENPEVEGQVAG